MIKQLFQSPLRVYLILGILSLLGIYSGLNLPISLFPNSTKTNVRATIPLYSMSPNDFYSDYGFRIESQLRSMDLKINNVKAEYNFGTVIYELDFDWSVNGDEALTRTKELLSSVSASFPQLMRENYYVHKWSENNTFIALSFYSEQRSTDQIYNIVQPIVEPQILSTAGVQAVELYNPQRKELTLELLPEKLASYGLHPQDIEEILRKSVREYNGGRIEYSTKKTQIFFDRWIRKRADLENFSFYNKNQIIYLKDIADIRYGASENSKNIFRTSGNDSLILWADPKPGANIKKMSDDIVSIIEKSKSSWPSDIKFKYLVNPAEFINSSVSHVMFEVILAAFLAVVILFLFIGSAKNVVTAAVEIPLSIILALILMKIFKMNLNMISLGGLALSAGMNVDASVVVIENIFRHLKIFSNKSKLEIIYGAVKEVYAPILVSTLASLIVFFPIIFTSGLTNSLLGDLAKTVIFSHALSAVVALILVPTVRLHFSNWFDGDTHSPIEKQLLWLEKTYLKLLKFLISKPKLVIFSSISILLCFILSVGFLLPKLPKQLIGKPETDWLILFSSSKEWQSVDDYDLGTSQIEQNLRSKFANDIDYTFTQNGNTWGNVMIKLKNKSKLAEVKSQIEKDYPDSPNLKISVDPWNPSELEIPDPPPFAVKFIGNDNIQKIRLADTFINELRDQKIFDSTRIFPDVSDEVGVNIKTYRPQYSPDIIANYIFFSGKPRNIISVKDNTSEHSIGVSIKLPSHYTQSLTNLKSMPYSQNGKVIPLGAVGDFEYIKEPKGLYFENGQDIVTVSARVNDPKKKTEAKLKAFSFLESFRDKYMNQSTVRVELKDSEKEITDSISELMTAIGISILSIFVLMIILFGNIIDALLILLAIPFGILGTIVSLTLFNSEVSLNSALGVILLNGISVANSIILVDFFKQLLREGKAPYEASLEASIVRLRPILMTSMATVIGMLPVAFGFGSGGKILQPLGISVSGGLWISMIFTLFFVPIFQVFYYQKKHNQKIEQLSPHSEVIQ